MISKVKVLSAATLLAMSAGSVSADDNRYIIQVDNDHKGVVKALAKKLGGQLNLDANGFFAATFDGKSLDDVKGLLNNPHIRLIEADARRVPLALFNDDAGDPTAQQLTPYAVYQSQADQVTLQMASAKKVCVIDSGIARDNGETGGYNADFDWSVITGSSDSGTGDWFRDGGPHGTHVAGTIAAADNGFGVIGMAPGNPLHIVKVFNASGWGYSSDLAYAAQQCSNAGSEIISMSLGGGGANSTEENAFNNFTANGGLVLAAAGNDGNNVRSFPAGYESVMMIGANDADNNIASFSQYPSNTKTSGRGKNVTTETNDGFGVEVTVGGVDTLSTYPSGATSLSAMTANGTGYASSAMENNGEASGSTFFMGTAESTNSGASGKICVIDRGVISFHDKVANCENSGGIGAIVINNEAGMLYGTLGTANSTSIPAVGAALEDRAALVAATTATVKVGASDYGYMSGTSMATPGASGIAALVWSNFPSCTGTEIRDAMKATAEDQGANGRDDYFGYGIVKAKAMYDYLAANGCDGGSTEPPTEPPSGDLTADGSRSKGGSQLDINWSGFSSSNVDISITWNGGSFNDTTANDGSQSYSGDKRTTYTITICEAGTTTCATSFNL
ncbi:S8 family serine peptidase [Pleionea litopenaei]|uniref:S8 family serine peptidase n=1 Tax=Pleionea litopenaei TaxID=3070815 RepID=A0AA51X611_9GAMM|nr:S8 family serine peptidase [Pleionea sp. HL-JVS1]WMS86394.1 S8 family serine peptidase [Pleionea sp. HL-JVS1]